MQQSHVHGDDNEGEVAATGMAGGAADALPPASFRDGAWDGGNQGSTVGGAGGDAIVSSVLLRWEGGLGASGRARDADRDRAGFDVDLERLDLRAVASVELIADLAVELHAH